MGEIHEATTLAQGIKSFETVGMPVYHRAVPALYSTSLSFTQHCLAFLDKERL